MATTSKQYKNIGEDLWKGRAEKIVSHSSKPPYLNADFIRMQNCLLSHMEPSSFNSFKTMKIMPK